MRRLRFQPGYLLAFVLGTNGLWLPLHFAVAHAPATESASAHAHSCAHHHHDHESRTDDEAPAAPEPHDCDLCDLLLSFSAAEVEKKTDAPPLDRLPDRVCVAPDRIVVVAPNRSFGARAPPIG